MHLDVAWPSILFSTFWCWVDVTKDKLHQAQQEANQEATQSSSCSQTSPQNAKCECHRYGWGQVRLDGLDVHKKLLASGP